MAFLLSLLTLAREVYDWTLLYNWRTWVGHALISVPILFIFGPLCGVAFYFVREMLQIGAKILGREPLDPVDHVGDVVSPMIVALLYYWSGLPYLIG